jgi:2-dehydro-3-deoxygalactonokinase
LSLNEPAWVVTLDGGTTHTRLALWRAGQVQARAHRAVGARDVAHQGRAVLAQAVQDCMNELLPGNPADGLVLASGAITSPQGLVDMAHVPTPAGPAELAAAMQRHDLPGIAAPCWWITGVRNHMPGPPALAEVGALDMMRGEEVETLALLDRMHLAGPATLLLPGSHFKLVRVDDQGRVAACVTTLTGEVLQALTMHTLIRTSLDGRFADHLDPGALRAGAAAARASGLSRAAFTVRVLDVNGLLDRNARACWLLGAVLADDLRVVATERARHPEGPLLLAGKPLLRDSLALLLADQGLDVQAATDDQQADLAGRGALRLAQARGLLPDPWPAARGAAA